MEGLPRHQCVIYNGSPSNMLPALAAHVKERLNSNFRCLYLNSAVMVAGLRSYLYAAGLDVADALAKGKLILSSDQIPLKGGKFDIERMLLLLEEALITALNDGYRGLWATGDMSWEMGLDRVLNRLLEYEWRLEKMFATYPTLSGICQYHADTLSREMLCHAVATHPALFINETLAHVNHKYIPGAVTSLLSRISAWYAWNTSCSIVLRWALSAFAS